MSHLFCPQRDELILLLLQQDAKQAICSVSNKLAQHLLLCYGLVRNTEKARKALSPQHAVTTSSGIQEAIIAFKELEEAYVEILPIDPSDSGCKMARILIAASEQALPQLGAALTGNEILQTTNLQLAARLMLEDGIDLFVVGVHFDDSRALELVKLVRLDPRHRQTPILVIRITPSTIPDVIQMSMEIMKSLDIINNYLELNGDPLAEIKIKDAVAELLANPKRLEARTVGEQDALSH